MFQYQWGELSLYQISKLVNHFRRIAFLKFVNRFIFYILQGLYAFNNYVTIKSDLYFQRLPHLYGQLAYFHLA